MPIISLLRLLRFIHSLFVWLDFSFVLLGAKIHYFWNRRKRKDGNLSFAKKANCPAVPLSHTVDTWDNGTAKGIFDRFSNQFLAESEFFSHLCTSKITHSYELYFST